MRRIFGSQVVQAERRFIVFSFIYEYEKHTNSQKNKCYQVAIRYVLFTKVAMQ